MGFPERVTNYREEVDGKVEEEKTDYKTLCNRGTTCFMIQKNLNQLSFVQQEGGHIVTTGIKHVPIS